MAKAHGSVVLRNRTVPLDLRVMGKSPGKWIKSVLFGKKSSKSSYPRAKEKAVNERQVLVAARVSESDLAMVPPFSSQLNPCATESDERKLELENEEAANISHDDGTSLPMSRDIDSQKFTLQDSPCDPERIKQEQAATLVQASFRGYLARRAFWALKGIIRLQALIRGHLVRRQAIATLCCMMGIVKLQAHVRGLMVRHSDDVHELKKNRNQINFLQESKLVVSVGVNMTSRIGKLSANAFVCKLVASSPTVMPLHLHYDVGESNSIWIWLERWSAYCFWKPIPQPKKAPDSKLQNKQVNGQAIETDAGRPKRSVRRIPPANLDGTSVQATSEFDKPKRNLRKISSHPAQSVQANPQNELEKVSSTMGLDIVEQSLNGSAEKTNKETAMTTNNSADEMKKEKVMTVNSSAEKIEKETAVNSSSEKRKKELAMAVNSSAEKMSQGTMAVNSSPEKMKKVMALTANSSAERMNKEMPVTVNDSSENIKKQMRTSKSPNFETVSGPFGMNEMADSLHADPAAVDSKPSTDTTANDENTSTTNMQLKRKDEPTKKEQQKFGRKSSNPAKQDRTENGTQNSPALPSYMAATESAKAKLRPQGSPRSASDGDDKSNLARRQSLPSANSKISSQSPKTHRQVHSAKAESRSDRTASSSRDGNGKATQAEWRR
ncbi:IQ-domain 28, putative isoform 3 [Hibiscus syriacus]|uniref:IQ-domain 28, putative isoform 3 n=1 Tax=Hibiscus syriacus TaxID=106335 RepID=A0A6A2ZR97_HIBSY|nr:IQ-domain 28, putative isoform 3 [Hibiscus syriacus]